MEETKGLSSIIGQEGAVGLLRAALTADRVASGYLLEGPLGIGKTTLAVAFAQALNCLQAKRAAAEDATGGCGVCDACHQIAAGAHPDFLFLRPDGQFIKIGQIRELAASLAFRPHQGTNRVIVLDPADQLTGEAANALLKTLEEPPADTHFLLLTSVAVRVPITLRSRCQRIRLIPMGAAAMAEALMTRLGISAEAAHAAVATAEGCVGRALSRAAATSAAPEVEAVDEILAALPERAATPMLELSLRLRDAKEGLPAILRLLAVTFRDALVLAQGVPTGPNQQLLRPDRAAAAMRLSTRGPKRLGRDVAVLLDTTTALERNTNVALCLETLLLALREKPAAQRMA